MNKLTLMVVILGTLLSTVRSISHRWGWARHQLRICRFAATVLTTGLFANLAVGQSIFYVSPGQSFVYPMQLTTLCYYNLAVFGTTTWTFDHMTVTDMQGNWVPGAPLTATATPPTLVTPLATLSLGQTMNINVQLSPNFPWTLYSYYFPWFNFDTVGNFAVMPDQSSFYCDYQTPAQPALSGTPFPVEFQIVAPTLIDPIADNLASGSGLVSNRAQLAAATHVVAGIAADGAAQILVRAPAANTGDQVQLTLFDENGPSSDGVGAGYLTALPANGEDTRTSGGVITVTAVYGGNGTAMAFAVYHAPSDFVRTGNTTDIESKIRSVTIGIADTTAGTTVTQPVSIVRPPVILVHGLWGEPSDFSGADGGVLGALNSSGLFTVSFGRYDNAGMGISSSNPIYYNPAATPLGASGNALGFQFGAHTILPQIVDFIDAYKAIALTLAAGPNSGAIAAVQADIVGHSMGGNVTRALPQLAEYATQNTYNTGYVHKLITIDTPHTGAKLASAILDPSNSCVESMLAVGGNYSFSSVVTADGRYISGAMGDLQPGSDALVAIHTGSSVIPTAMIGAQLTPAQLDGAGKTGAGRVIASICSTFSNPLAIELNSLYWPDVVGSATDPSDAIVPLSSQFDGEQATYPVANPAAAVYGLHSKGPVQLGFPPPTVLDQASCAGQTSCAPTEVINLLNTPVSTATVFEIKP
jgi:pimeloyl-ACP methyl ester carboxylesterase